MKPKSPKSDEPADHGWKPHVDWLGYTCDYSATSSCCDSGVHHGTWHGKPGWMCQKCGKSCERVGRRM